MLKDAGKQKVHSSITSNNLLKRTRALGHAHLEFPPLAVAPFHGDAGLDLSKAVEVKLSNKRAEFVILKLNHTVIVGGGRTTTATEESGFRGGRKKVFSCFCQEKIKIRKTCRYVR